VPFPVFRERRPPQLEANGERVPVATLSYSAPGRVRAPLVRAGRGCRRGDFARARRRIALVERGRCIFRVKARLAQAAGARALVVADPASLLPVPGSSIRPGNGSGVASTLALAERLRGRRGLRFGFWAAEELGLYGSRRYVASLSAAERRRIAGYINLDMVGSPNPVRYVYGHGPARAALERALRARRLRFQGISIDGSSDHAPFERAGISVGGLYSGSDERKTAAQATAYGGRAGRPLDSCYHQRCDMLARVDRQVLAELADAAGRALVAIH
jgi:Peptidase family M28/PA domain